MSEERHLYGSSTEFTEKVESLEGQLKKMGDNIFRGEIEAEIVSLVICIVVDELVRWEKDMLTREEALWGQLITLEAQYHDIDSLKKNACRSVLYQLEYLALELLAFCASFRLF